MKLEAHAVILAAALQLNKHIYCAKPVTHTVAEARHIRKAVAAAPKERSCFRLRP